MKTAADSIFINGKIYTMVSENDTAEALCVKDGVIVYTGTTQEALERFTAPQVVDLEGKTMLPGLGDSHLHFFAYCQTQTMVDLSGCKSKEEMIAALAAKGIWTRPARSTPSS